MSQAMTNVDYSITDEETVSEAVVKTVASAEGVDPTELDTRLYDAVDPDALDRLFRSDSLDGHVRLSYCGYEVSIHASGRLLLTDG